MVPRVYVTRARGRKHDRTSRRVIQATSVRMARDRSASLGATMLRRTLVITSLVVLTLACAAAPALALELLWSQDVAPQARLATGTSGPVVAWQAAGVGMDSVQATQYRRTDHAAYGPRTLIPQVAGLQDWYVAGDGAQNVTIVWKAGGAVYAKRVDLATGSALYGPVPVCTDAKVARHRSAGSTAELRGAAGDGRGGIWVWLAASPTSTVAGVGDSLLNHVSSTGTVAVADPGVAVAKGIVEGLGVDAAGHAVVLLGPPGRAGVATQRYDTDGTTDWAAPSTPYNPLLPPPRPATQEPIGVTAGTHAAIAWREGSKVKMQRFSLGRRPAMAHTRRRHHGGSSQAVGRRHGRVLPRRPIETRRHRPTPHRRRRAGSGLAERAAGRGALEAAGGRSGGRPRRRPRRRVQRRPLRRPAGRGPHDLPRRLGRSPHSPWCRSSSRPPLPTAPAAPTCLAAGARRSSTTSRARPLRSASDRAPSSSRMASPSRSPATLSSAGASPAVTPRSSYARS